MKHASSPRSWLYRQKIKGMGIRHFGGQGVLGQHLGWAAVLCALPGAGQLGAHPPRQGPAKRALSPLASAPQGHGQ